MATRQRNDHEISQKRASGSDKAEQPSRKGGSPVRNAEKWGGGSKGSKGPITDSDRRNPNSSQRS